jgi:hypothetical protein
LSDERREELEAKLARGFVSVCPFTMLQAKFLAFITENGSKKYEQVLQRSLTDA